MRLRNRSKRARSMRSTLRRKLERISRNREEIETILIRGAVELPEEYLVCHQQAEPERTAKVLDQAEQRRRMRNTKRALHVHGVHADVREEDVRMLLAA